MYLSADISFSASVETVDAAADLRVSLNSLSYSLGNVTVNYTVSNAGIASSTAVDLDFWLDSGTPPASGSVGDSSVAIDAIAPGADYTGSAIISVGTLESGTFYAYVDPEDVLSEVDETNNVSTGWNWALPLQGAQSFDFEDGSIPVDLMASGNAGWQIDASTASSGVYSIRASSITDSQSACLAVTAANSSAITFDWKVDSESYYDYLSFYIDGSEQIGRISGIVDWAGKSFSGLAPGTHEYKWCYIKDSSLSSGSDTAWVDNIQVN
jgi:hypothetical protein